MLQEVTPLSPECQQVTVRANALLVHEQGRLYRRMDRNFACLMMAQWIVGILIALYVSPTTWSGLQQSVHVHVWAAVFLGGLISFFPVYLAIFHPGRKVTRYSFAIGQVMTSGLLIHLSGGRIETHFHIFGSMAFIACYRDWKLLVPATLLVAFDHFIRGMYAPQSVYGVLSTTPWRSIEHSGWVLFENMFLIISIKQGLLEMKQRARQQAELELTNQRIEKEVLRRTEELRETHQQLVVSEERLNHALDATCGGIWDWNVQTDYTYRSPELIRLFGCEEHEVIPNNAFWQSCVHPDELEGVLKKLNEHLQGDSPVFESVYRLKNRQLGYRWHASRGKVVSWDDDGNPIRMVGTIQDLTEQRQIQKDLKEAKEAAEAANHSKSEFLANMSHEIRTPMTAILGFTDILLENVHHKENIHAAKTIKENGDYLLSLLNDILDLSKIEAGKFDIEKTRFSLVEVIEDVVSLMNVRSSEKGLELKTEYEGLIPATIESDPTRLRQILINLVGNAIKFTEVGAVTIKVKLLNSDSSSPQLQLKVIDSGIGIEESKFERVFNPFTQSDTSTTRKFGGTGLGLTISKRLAEALGGSISLCSVLGQGSTFSVTLDTGPVKKQDLIRPTTSEKTLTEEFDSTPEVGKNPVLNCHILLAEDGEMNQRLITHLLKKAGAQVEVAENGQVAFEKYASSVKNNQPFDVILMDMQMPILDGYSATSKLREADCELPIIALTAHAMSGDREKCLAAGCDDYATKPIDKQKLYSMIGSYLAQPIK